MHPFIDQRAGQALTANLTNLANHTKDHRRKSTVGGRVLVIARTFAQG
jgi:hypothetical protein